MNRRDFLVRMGTVTAGGLLLRGWPAWAGPGSATDRVLVMIVFQGGNDGLNTIVPYTDPAYYSHRPDLAVTEAEVFPLAGGLGLHPALDPLLPLWKAGELAVIQGVGYPDMNLSHFRGTDIVFSASGSETVLSTGWLGRWLASNHPQFPDRLPETPMALQQGLSARLPLLSEAGVAGVVVDNPSSFFKIVNRTYSGETEDSPPDTPGGDALRFVREVDSTSFEYASVIQNASERGRNRVDYPGGRLGGQLATVARLIEGNLGASVYVASLGGFDTHANQKGRHNGLLTQFARAVKAFLDDLETQGRKREVLVLTVSEFGRRVKQNGSMGTDHGTAAPWFVIGGGVEGGLYGSRPDLNDLDRAGTLRFAVDYRSVYATLLDRWWGAGSDRTRSVLHGDFPTLDFLG
jgi:uncharacterized protein (DUF1501 family)